MVDSAPGQIELVAPHGTLVLRASISGYCSRCLSLSLLHDVALAGRLGDVAD